MHMLNQTTVKTAPVGCTCRFADFNFIFWTSPSSSTKLMLHLPTEALKCRLGHIIGGVTPPTNYNPPAPLFLLSPFNVAYIVCKLLISYIINIHVYMYLFKLLSFIIE